MLSNTKNGYGLIARMLHWLMAIMIIAMLATGLIMSDMENSEQKFQLYYLHKATGVLVLLVALLRLIWKLVNVTVVTDISLWQRRVANIAHFLLYFLMIAMPVSGIMMSIFGGRSIDIYNIFTLNAFDKNEQISSFSWSFHGYLGWSLIILITLHILAALYHYFIKNDQVLQTMMVQK